MTIGLGYRRIQRDLNYGQYFDQGDVAISDAEEYSSHNTELLGVAQVMEKIKTLDIFQQLAGKSSD